MDTTSAIIQFIGIVMFSTQVPDDPGLHAILPRIGQVHTSHLHTLPRPEAPENLTRIGSAGIENHVSVIMYRDTDRVNRTTGWRSDGRLANGWKYVVLSGERVEFITNAENRKPAIPAGLPRTGASHSCNRTAQSLRPEYQPPYRGAVAVIDITEGELSSCETNTPATTARVDTRLRLNTGKTFAIAGTKNGVTKKIVLAGNAVVFVANVPPYTLLKDVNLSLGAPHWMVYNSMLSEPCASRPEVDAGYDQAIVYCDKESLGESYHRASKKPPMDFRMIDSGCSVTQWP